MYYAGLQRPRLLSPLWLHPCKHATHLLSRGGIHVQGSCGYGLLDKSKWPYWSVGALSTSNIFYGQGPVRGCGCGPFHPM